MGLLETGEAVRGGLSLLSWGVGAWMVWRELDEGRDGEVLVRKVVLYCMRLNAVRCSFTGEGLGRYCSDGGLRWRPRGTQEWLAERECGVVASGLG